jgi:hypothetical protein
MSRATSTSPSSSDPDSSGESVRDRTYPGKNRREEVLVNETSGDESGSGGRYEVAVDTALDLRKPGKLGPLKRLTKEPVSIWFQGRRFTWHPRTDESMPIVTVPFEDSGNYEEERFAMEKFLSALSFHFNAGITVVVDASTGFKSELDTPLLRQPPMRGATFPSPNALQVPEDEELALCLGHMREGRSATSLAYQYLSFWKVIEVAVGAERFMEWVGSAAEALWHEEGLDATGWFARLNDARNASAHAIRNNPESLRYYPDDPSSRLQIRDDADKVRRLAKQAIERRWPQPVKETNIEYEQEREQRAEPPAGI